MVFYISVLDKFECWRGYGGYGQDCSRDFGGCGPKAGIALVVLFIGHAVVSVSRISLSKGEIYITKTLGLVARDSRVDGSGPGVDASGEGLDVLETLVAEPHGYAEGTGSMVAEDNDGLVGVELLVGAGGYFAHGHKKGAGNVGGLVFPRFADVEEKRGVGLLALLGEGADGDLWV
jgi:hypothetical protein